MHFIPVSKDIAFGVNTIANKYVEAILNKELPKYPQFVDALFKELDSVEASAIHAAIGCAGEGGELLDCVKKVWIYGKKWDQFDPKTNDTPIENLLEELGDFRFYYQKLLNMLCVTDEQIQALNVAKLRKRYPKGQYSNEAAQQRADKSSPPPLNTVPFDPNIYLAKEEVKVSERKFFGQVSESTDVQPVKGSPEWASKVSAGMDEKRKVFQDAENAFLTARKNAIAYIAHTFDNMSPSERAKWLAKERTLSFDLLAEVTNDYDPAK